MHILAFPISSSEEQVDINEIQIKHDDFDVKTKGVIQLNYDGREKYLHLTPIFRGQSIQERVANS